MTRFSVRDSSKESSISTLVLFNKPYRVLSERAGEAGKQTVADFVPIPGLDPAGRLDYDSEGLVVLTDAGWLQHLIIHPDQKLPKRYWVQVEGAPNAAAVQQLARGVQLKDGKTRPAQVRPVAAPPVWPRTPPVQERADLPSTWLEIILTEGKKRQIRRMTAAVGHPTLRLVRVQVGAWQIGNLAPGEWRQEPCPVSPREFGGEIGKV